MQHTHGGYTLIEVLMVLAITSLLLVAGLIVVKGQAAHTEFTTSMNNVNSKMQQWIDQVVNGYSKSPAQATTSNYECDTSDPGGYPKLTSSSSARVRGANPDCIFLGTAVFATPQAPDNDKLFAYTVIARRTTVLGNDLAKSLTEAKPTAVINPPSTLSLIEEFKIPNGAIVLSVKSSSPAPLDNSHLVGLYGSLNNGDGNSGASSIRAYQYPYTALTRTSINDCIKGVGGCTGEPPAMQNWKICFGSTRNSDKAEITINSSNGFSALTKLNLLGPGSACS